MSVPLPASVHQINSPVDVVTLADRITNHPRYSAAWEAMRTSNREIAAMASTICAIWPLLEAINKLRVLTDALENADQEADQAELSEQVLELWDGIKTLLDEINQLRSQEESSS